MNELLVPRITLATIQQTKADGVREQSLLGYGRMKEAYELLSGVIGGLLLRVNEIPFEFDQRTEHIDGLCAAFVIGMPVCKDTIERGAYIQALTLLRQEMELLAQIKHVKAGTHKPKSAPNLKELEETIRRLYNNLSEVAHVSTPEVVFMATFMDLSGDQAYPEGTSGTRYFPAFDYLICRRAFALHILLLSHIRTEMAENFTNRLGQNPLTDAEVDAINVALWLLEEEGMIERPNPLD